MAAALGVGTMAGGIGSANIVLAEEQNEDCLLYTSNQSVQRI